jgi:hypothetical protein
MLSRLSLAILLGSATGVGIACSDGGTDANGETGSDEPCASGSNNHVGDDGQCYCDEGFEWCYEDGLDCCEAGMGTMTQSPTGTGDTTTDTTGDTTGSTETTGDGDESTTTGDGDGDGTGGDGDGDGTGGDGDGDGTGGDGDGDGGGDGDGDGDGDGG